MKILIATVTAGGGHLQAAAAIEEAWTTLFPRDQVTKVDLLDFVSGLQRRVYLQTYVKLVEHAPEMWGLVFKKTDNNAWVQKLTRFRRAYARTTNRRFVKHVEELAPDLVISTHYLPVEIMGHLQSKGGSPSNVCVITDYEAHALWLEQAVDLYCVAAPETRASLISRNVSEDRIRVTGIPISQRFKKLPRRPSVRKALGLRHDHQTLLVLSGGFGMGPVADMLQATESIETPLQTLVVTGRNQELRAELAVKDYRHPTRILGYVQNIHELMVAADLIASKPGGLTTSEALAVGRPLLLLDPIPGQETANSDFLLEHGAAVKVNRVEDLSFRLKQLLEPRRLNQLARSAKALGRPDAADALCQSVKERLNSR